MKETYDNEQLIRFGASTGSSRRRLRPGCMRTGSVPQC